MTVGDMVSGHTTVLSGQYVTIVPATSSVEWVIHNIYIALGSSTEVYRTDGTTPVKLMNSSTSLLSYEFHCSTSSYITIKNVGSTTLTIGYDGIVMQET